MEVAYYELPINTIQLILITFHGST